MDHPKVKSSTAALRIAVAVGVGVVAHTLNPSTGDVAQAYAQVASGPGSSNQAGECASGFCGTTNNDGGGSGSGSGSSVWVALMDWLGLF